MKVNLGCGEFPLDGYVNVDEHDPRADLAGDMRGLDFTNVDEVAMFHSLEHVGWRETPGLLARVRGWLREGGRVVVEVPDMQAIMSAPGPHWLTDVYGVQTHEGEYHRQGFTANTLAAALGEAGFRDIRVRRFASPHPARSGMPCLEATGTR